jgi:pimeloyl-ACP methyl ester carboxylesterase
MLVDVEGVRLNVLNEGSGHPVLFLHGLGGCWRDWEPQLDSFSEEFRVIVPEHRGHGRSDRPLGHYSMSRFAADIRTVCGLLDIDHTYVVGLSMGGMIAQWLALDYPELVDALVLADTVGRMDSPTQELLRGTVPTIRQDGLGIVQMRSPSACVPIWFGTICASRPGTIRTPMPMLCWPCRSTTSPIAWRASRPRHSSCAVNGIR